VLSPAGITYNAYTTRGPNRITFIRFDPRVLTVDVGLARNRLGTFARTSAIARAHHAAAAINGDFGLFPGRPGHAYIEDGELIQTSVLNREGKYFAVSRDGVPHIGHVDLQVRAVPSSGEPLVVDRWNEGDPRNNQVAAFTAAGGTAANPGAGCAARLVPATAPRWGAGMSAVRRDYRVADSRCWTAAPRLQGDDVVLVANAGTPSGRALAGLRRGTGVTVTWSMGWPGVVDAIGGSPVLIEGGRLAVSKCKGYLCRRHTRSAVGITADGDVMFFQVDGRSSASVGMTLVQLAREMKKRGAVWALNLDGGGSSTLWIRGAGVVNSPSDGHERKISNALLVLSRPDAGEPPSLA
jgi:hypothetical protein